MEEERHSRMASYLASQSSSPREKSNQSRGRPPSVVGIDVVGGLLTEVNVTSPTGVQEINAIEGCLHDDTVILIDDCDLPNGGKGKLVIQYLTEAGWKVHMSEYQVIMLMKG